tara:strand:- start:146 stop:436 length:291 start_codon:yes stop_codon:yes gene_type:complete
MELIKQISELTKKDSFLVAVSVKKGEQIETQCLTSNFDYADIPIATQDVLKNIQKLAIQVAPPVPSALQEAGVADPDNPDSIPEAEDVVVYADGEE